MPDRVRTRRQFALFSKPNGRGQSGPLRISFVSGDQSVAVAYAISRKVGNAVERNLIRRRLRALMDELSPDIQTGNYLIRVGNEAKSLTYDELRHHAQRAVQRANTGS